MFFFSSNILGDKLRVDLRKKDISTTKMAILEQKFDEVKVNGLLMPSALSAAITNNDELDNDGQVKTYLIYVFSFFTCNKCVLSSI